MGKVVACIVGQATTKTLHQSTRLALLLHAEEATLWCQLNFQVEDDSQDKHCAKQISSLQIDNAADCAVAWTSPA